jgi:starch synthase
MLFWLNPYGRITDFLVQRRRNGDNRMKMSRILMVAGEAMPFIKTGGLADVLGALPAALRERGEQVAVVLPWYRKSVVEDSRLVLEQFPVWLGKISYPVRVHVSTVRGVPYYLVECPPLYDRDGVYVTEETDFPDNHVRYAVLSRAALAVARWVFRPEILHCHDWQAGLVPVYLRNPLAGDPVFLGVKVLLTLHNLGYQGLFPVSALGQMGLDSSVFHFNGLEYFGKVNVLKGGIVYSDALSTVSKAYAREIQTPEYGQGMDGLLASRSAVLTGILNGADYSEWNPETDRHIAANYSSRQLAGKHACKRALLAEFGLPSEALERPLVGMVSRLDRQKGFDLIEEAAGALAREDLSLVVLGTGNARYEELLAEMARAYPTRFAVKVGYDEALAHRIEAGADIFLMPSRYEPCGLSQIYSLRYGTVPVVRATGGLDDTIDRTTGFKFKEFAAGAMLAALRSALEVYGDPDRWKTLMLSGMARDYSWAVSAGEYSALYNQLRLHPEGG